MYRLLCDDFVTPNTSPSCQEDHSQQLTIVQSRTATASTYLLLRRTFVTRSRRVLPLLLVVLQNHSRVSFPTKIRVVEWNFSSPLLLQSKQTINPNRHRIASSSSTKVNPSLQLDTRASLRFQLTFARSAIPSTTSSFGY